MLERRQRVRTRVIYLGRIVHRNHLPPIDCVIRNFSDDGARIEFDNHVLLPDEFDLLIAKKARIFRAKLTWCSPNRAGLTFRPATRNNVICLDHERRWRRCRSERRNLQGTLARLLSEH